MRYSRGRKGQARVAKRQQQFMRAQLDLQAEHADDTDLAQTAVEGEL